MHGILISKRLCGYGFEREVLAVGTSILASCGGGLTTSSFDGTRTAGLLAHPTGTGNSSRSVGIANSGSNIAKSKIKSKTN